MALKGPLNISDWDCTGSESLLLIVIDTMNM